MMKRLQKIYQIKLKSTRGNSLFTFNILMNQNASMASLPSSFDLEYEQVLILACLYLKIAFGELTKF
jgi:hypothetical protein